MNDSTFFGWFVSFFLEDPVDAIQFILLLFFMPTLWVIIYIYIRRNKIGLSKALFGDPNGWLDGSITFKITDVYLFGMAVYVGLSRRLFDWRAKLQKWGQTETHRRKQKHIGGASFLGYTFEDGKYEYLKNHYPWFVRLCHALTITSLSFFLLGGLSAVI